MDSSKNDLISFHPELERLSQQGNLDKVSRYKWNSIGPTGDFQWINKSLLHIDRLNYQRDDKKTKHKIAEMTSVWNWQSCNAISVMQRDDGIYVVVDGQHRVLAAWNRVDITDLPCMVFKSTGIKHEAEAFIDLNTNRKPVSAFAKYRAKLAAGNSLAQKINYITAAHGIIIREDSKAAASVSCVSKIEKLAADNEDRFQRVFAMAAKLAKADDVHIAEVLLDGLTVIDRAVLGGLENNRLSTRIMHVGAKALVENAMKMSYRAGKGGSRVWAEGMMEVLNRGLRSKFKLEA